MPASPASITTAAYAGEYMVRKGAELDKECEVALRVLCDGRGLCNPYKWESISETDQAESAAQVIPKNPTMLVPLTPKGRKIVSLVGPVGACTWARLSCGARVSGYQRASSLRATLLSVSSHSNVYS
jgi:hypothetical protein